MTKSDSLLKPGQSRLISIRDLLQAPLSIPIFQRPYDWRDKQVQEFIKDLEDSSKKRVPLFCGMVVLAPGNEQQLLVVDGQQRLTTFMLALAATGQQSLVLSPAPRQPWIRTREDDQSYLVQLIQGKALSRETETQSQLFLRSAWNALSTAATEGKINSNSLLTSSMIVYVAPSIAGATGLFERINLRGRDVSQFDLVKNKLIDWTQVVTDEDQRISLHKAISSTYGRLYKMLNPVGHDGEHTLNSDRLLRVHWILFDTASFKSSDHVLDHLEARLWDVHAMPERLCEYICEYLDSLEEVCAEWVKIQRPYNELISPPELREALLDFRRLDREGEYEPVLVAAMIRLRKQAHQVVRFCEISMFRSVLSKHRSNTYRSIKWRIGKALYQKSLKDSRGKKISSAEALNNLLFWGTSPYWGYDESESLDAPLSNDELSTLVLPENALSNPDFYNQYRFIIRYFFWKYGVFLSKTRDPNLRMREEMRHFADELWFKKGEGSFDTWDIEHIYPCQPDDRNTREGQRYMKDMRLWLHHLGNLTMLPRAHNRSVGNIDFDAKMKEFRGVDKVSFNLLLERVTYRGKLMNKPRWGANNCQRRIEHLKDFATQTWGPVPLANLGIKPYDNSVEIDDEFDDSYDNE